MNKKTKIILVLGILGGLILISLAIYSIFFAKEKEAVFQSPIPTLPVEEDFSKEFNQLFIKSEQALDLSSQVVGKKGEARKKTVDEARQKLTERKKGLVDLMQKDPNLAWTVIYPPDVQRQIPEELRGEVEQPITVRTRIDVVHADDFEGGRSRFFYYLNIYDNGGIKKTPLYMAGTPPEVLSDSEVEVHGYKIDDNIIASVEGGTVKVISAAKPESLGEQKTLVVLVDFLDSKKPPPISKRQADQLVFGGKVKSFFRENSYNKTYFTGKVADWHTIPRTAQSGEKDCRWLTEVESEEVYPLIKDSFNLASYGRLVFLINADTNSGRCFTQSAGQGEVGKITRNLEGVDYKFSVAWISVNPDFLFSFSGGTQRNSLRRADYVLSHELGHNLGVYHANSWNCPGAEILGSDCQHGEYGNGFDIMGSGRNSFHSNAFFKEALGWLRGESSLIINKPGTYSLNPLELDKGRRLAKIQNPNNKTFPFYLEYRQGVGFDSGLNREDVSTNQNGLFVNWIPGDSPLGSRLLDMSPQSSDDPWSDWDIVVLPQGDQIFKDPGRGITIGPVISANRKEITFAVNFFEPECRRLAPKITSDFRGLNIAPGVGGFQTSISILNPDEAACDLSTFELRLEVPRGWQGEFTDTSENKYLVGIKPGINPFPLSYRVTIPQGTGPGEYLIKAAVNNLSSGLKSELDFPVVIRPGPSEFVKEEKGAPLPSGTLGQSPSPAQSPPALVAESPPAPSEPPTVGEEKTEQPLGVSILIANFYEWALGIGALIALLVLIYGGIVYTTSAGNESRIGDAKEWIFGAVIGLFLLFGSFLILNTINPELTKLKDLRLIVNEAAQSSSAGDNNNVTYSPQPGDVNPSAICVNYLGCKSIYDNDCQGAVCNYPSDVFPEGQTILLDSMNIPFVSGASGVRIKSDLRGPLARAGEVANSRGYTLALSSGYRSLKRQLEIALADWSKVPARVAYPGGSNHGSGKAVDVVLVGGPSVGSPEYCQTLAEIMYQAGWERYIPEYWHFEYPAGSGNPTRSTSLTSC